MTIKELNVPQLRRLAVRVNVMSVVSRRSAKKSDLLNALNEASIAGETIQEVVSGRDKLESIVQDVMTKTLNMGRKFNDVVSKPKRNKLPSNYLNRVIVDSPSSDTDYVKQLRDKLNERDLPGNKMKYRTLTRNFFRSKGATKLKWKREIVSFMNLVSPSGMIYGEFPDYPGMYGFFGSNNSEHISAVVDVIQDRETEREFNTVDRKAIDGAARKMRALEINLRESGQETAGDAIEECIKILREVNV